MATTIQLGGKERELRFTYMSMKSLEAHYGKSIQRVFDEDFKDGGLDSVTMLLWACLRKEKLTVAKIDQLIEDSIETEEITMKDIGDKLKVAIENSKVVKGIKADEQGDDEAKN
ncbi:hypothetical protein ACNA6I_01480 [Rossellomorea sp. FS2]